MRKQALTKQAKLNRYNYTPATLAHFYYTTLLHPSNPATLPPCHPGTLLLHYYTLAPWQPGTLAPFATTPQQPKPWHPGTLRYYTSTTKTLAPWHPSHPHALQGLSLRFRND